MQTSFIPRYHEIERVLRERITQLHPGDPLPSDTDLCREFSVSRMTARNAMARLAQAGLVYRVPGRGTFVAEEPPHRQAGSLLSFTREMMRRGQVPTSRILELGLRTASEAELTALRLRPGADVLAIRRLRIADGDPIAIETAVLRSDCERAVRDLDLERESLHAALVASGTRLVRGRATLWAESATTDDAELLEIDPGSPLLIERRVIVDQRSRPIERTESRYAAERYALDVDFYVEEQSTPDRD